MSPVVGAARLRGKRHQSSGFSKLSAVNSGLRGKKRGTGSAVMHLCQDGIICHLDHDSRTAEDTVRRGHGDLLKFFF